MRAQVPAAREMELPFEPYNTDLIEAEGFDPIVMMPRLAEEEEDKASSSDRDDDRENGNTATLHRRWTEEELEIIREGIRKCKGPALLMALLPGRNRTQIRGAIARERGKGVEALPTYPAPSPTSSSKPALPSNPPPASDTTTTPEDKKPVESRVSGGASPQWSSPGSSNGSTSSEDEKPPYNSNSPLRLGKG